MVCILDSTVMPNTQSAVLETGGFPSSCQTKSGLTFKNRASYIEDGRTATLQMLHIVYFFFQQI
jgi:hypothetical protein